MASNLKTIFRGAAKGALAASLGIVLAAPAQAVQWRTDSGLNASFDTTITYGLSLRTERPEGPHTGPPNAGGNWANQYGNRDVFKDKWDIFSNSVRASHEFALTGDQWTVFARGNYFYDFAMANETDKLNHAAENRAVQHGDITDLYGILRFGDNDRFTLRAGKQVISWGESAFYPNSINSINTVDVTKLRQPGVEIKDAFVGTPAIDFNWIATDALSLEAFYLLGFDEAKGDVAGSFFSGLDGAADGGGFINSATGGPFGGPTCLNASTVNDIGPAGPFGCTFGYLTRAGDKIPSGSGQWGIAARYYFPDIGAGLETGFYYTNLHSHIPNFSGISGTGAPLSGLEGQFLLEYQKNQERYGVSYNTVVGPWAIGGEFSYSPNFNTQGGEFFGYVIGFPVGGVLPPAGTFVSGLKEYERYQVQNTFQRLWGPIHAIGADQLVTFGEVVYGWSGAFPSQGATSTSTFGPFNFNTFENNLSSDWASIQMINNLTYNNALFNRVNVTYKSSVLWDFHGNEPTAGAKMIVEGRKALTLGTEFEYALRWKASINHTWFWNGDNECDNIGPSLFDRCYNTASDRDFLSMDISYTF